MAWIPLWFVLANILMAIIEYTLHRYPMHRKGYSNETWESHAKLHHGRFFPRSAFTHPLDIAARYVSVDLQPGYNALGLSPIWIILYFFVSPYCGLTFAFVFAMHGVIWTICHREMHFPQDRWFSGTKYYKYICAYHKKHHTDQSGNFSVIYPPVLDMLFGTYRGLEQ